MLSCHVGRVERVRKSQVANAWQRRALRLLTRVLQVGKQYHMVVLPALVNAGNFACYAQLSFFCVRQLRGSHDLPRAHANMLHHTRSSKGYTVMALSLVDEQGPFVVE